MGLSLESDVSHGDRFCKWDPTLSKGISLLTGRERKLMGGNCKSEVLEQKSNHGTPYPTEGTDHGKQLGVRRFIFTATGKKRECLGADA